MRYTTIAAAGILRISEFLDLHSLEAPQCEKLHSASYTESFELTQTPGMRIKGGALMEEALVGSVKLLCSFIIGYDCRCLSRFERGFVLFAFCGLARGYFRVAEGRHACSALTECNPLGRTAKRFESTVTGAYALRDTLPTILQPSFYSCLSSSGIAFPRRTVSENDTLMLSGKKHRCRSAHYTVPF